jgi:rhamnosyltransferase
MVPPIADSIFAKLLAQVKRNIAGRLQRLKPHGEEMSLGYSRLPVEWIDTDKLNEPSEEETRASIAAVIVLYYPQPFLLSRLIESALPQVNKLFIIDNTPSWDKQTMDWVTHGALQIVYRAKGFNAGLASAQNDGIRNAIQDGYTHVLLLDQDSALPKNAVSGLLAAERSLVRAGRQVAAVGPIFIDEKSGRRSQAVREAGLRVRWQDISTKEMNPIETDYLIASGSLIRTSVLKKVGYMRDELFIDWVDTEWAYRAKGFGFAGYIVPTVVMRHSIGDETQSLLGKRIYLHNPIRNYYIVRNAMYLLQNPKMSWKWRITMLTYVPKYILVHSWLARNRRQSLMQMLQGMCDGLMRKMRPYSML